MPPDHPLRPGQIVDSNQYALAALVEQTGAVPVPLGIIPDHPQALAEGIQTALQKAGPDPFFWRSVGGGL